MKKHIIILFALLSTIIAYSQNKNERAVTGIVSDPGLTAVVTSATVGEIETQRLIHEDQEKTATFQAEIAAMQTTIKRIEQKTYEYLSTASSIISVIRHITEMRDDIEAIGQNLDEARRIVQDEPYLLLTTFSIDTVVYNHIIELFEYVTNIAFVWDNDGSGHSNNDRPKNLLNNAERMEIVYNISKELKIIRGYTNYLKYHLKAAKKQTVFQNLCPYTYQVIRNCQTEANYILQHFNL